MSAGRLFSREAAALPRATELPSGCPDSTILLSKGHVMRHFVQFSLAVATLLVLAAALSVFPSGAQEQKKGEAAAAAAAAPQAAAKGASASAPAASGKTYTVSRGPFKHEIELDATVVAATSQEVFIQPEEPIQLIVREAAPHGTRVTKGQTLVKFDATRLDRQVRDLEAAKALAELNLKDARREAELIARTAPLDVELAERMRKQADEDLARFEKSDRAFREKSSGYNVTQLTNQLEYVEEELKQLEKMYKADDLTEETEEIVLKRARNDVTQMKHFLDMAKYNNERTTQVELPRSLASYQQSAARAALLAEKARLASPSLVEQQKLAAEKLEFEQRKAADQLARLKSDRDKLTVTSPADGVLYYGRWRHGKWTGSSELAQKLQVGGQLQPHELVLSVVHTGPIEVLVAVPEKDLAHVHSGIAGQFHAKAWPDEKVSVKVTKVTTAPYSEGAFGATLAPTGAVPDKLVAGMTGKVKIVAYFKVDALTVPSKAVFRDDADDDKRYVLVVGKDGKHQRRDVTVGHSTEKSTEITAGLSVGDKILLDKPEGGDTTNSSGAS
jgi:HlyD family secretion protein